MAMVDAECPLFENEEWCVTEDGLEHRRTGYFIDRSDLDQKRDGDLWAWPLHMAEKSWCAMAPFMEAFDRAAELYGFEASPGLARSYTIAAHDIALWPGAETSLEGSEKASRMVANLLQNAGRAPISIKPDPVERQSNAALRTGPVHHAYRVRREHRNLRMTARTPNGSGWMPSASSGRAGIGTRLVRLLQAAWSEH